MSTKRTYDRPDYAINALADRLAAIKGGHLDGDVEVLRRNFDISSRDELQIMRAAYDGDMAPDFWRCEGQRAITAAHEHEYRLAMFRDSLKGCAYVRHGHSVMPRTWCVYRHDSSSPTRVKHSGGFDFCPEADALVEAARVAALPPVQFGEHR